MTTSPIEIADRLECAVDPIDDRVVVDGLAAFLRRALPEERQRELEATSTFPDAELRALAAEGFVRPFVPSAHGGELDWSLGMRIAVRFAAHDLDTAACFGGTVLATTPMLVAATPEQAGPFFAAIARGEMAGFALSEWDHGSDLASNAARATETREGFVLNGTKSPTNNGSRSAFVVALLRTSDDPAPFGQTLFLIPREVPGLVAHPRFKSLGYRSMDLSGIILGDVRLSRAAVLGRVGEGFAVARRALEISRSGVATMGAGVAAACLARALVHARTRVLYGSPIADLAAVRVTLGRLVARALECSATCRRTARAVQSAALSARAWTSMAKLLTPRLAEECVHDAGTILGARSLMDDHPLSRLRRSAPVLAIFDGSSQLQLDEIWRAVGRWSDAPCDAWAALRAPARFDANGEDDGTIARASPPAVLRAGGHTVLADAAMELAVLARSLRGAPQPIRFRTSDVAARLFGVASLAEAAAHGDELVAAAFEARAAELGPVLASALGEIAHALGEAPPRTTASLMRLAVTSSDMDMRCFALFERA